MSVVWDVQKIGKDEALPTLKNMVNGYMSGRSAICVGVTDNPDRRWRERQGESAGWVEMIVVYEAFSGAIAIDMERALIAHAKGVRYNCEVLNRGPGGEWVRAEGKFVYLLVGARRR